MPAISHRARSDFHPAVASSQFSEQWTHPSDVFSVLLLLGGDVVARALAQLVGSRVTPVAFSFGWVAYAVSAVVSAAGENKLMPAADYPCKVINGRNGFVRDNSSWIIGRIVRDFETWMDRGQPEPYVRNCVENLINDQWEKEKAKAIANADGVASIALPERPRKVGLCVSIYKAKDPMPGYPGYDRPYMTGLFIGIVQLGLAAIPCGLFGDWGILLVTAAGIVLSFVSGALPQWAEEKWACQRGTTKTIVLTRGNGSQHAIAIIGDGKGLDLEDLAAVDSTSLSSRQTRFATIVLAILWILLLITAAGIQRNTWFLLAVGGVGILQNIYAAGINRSPEAFGVPLEFVEVIGEPKVMSTLFEVEERYPRLGRSMLSTFFPGDLHQEEIEKWDMYDKRAKEGEK